MVVDEILDGEALRGVGVSTKHEVDTIGEECIM